MYSSHSFQNSESNYSICNISTSHSPGFSHHFFEDDYVSLEDLENQIDKKTLLCFSNTSSNINNESVIDSNKSLENNNEKNSEFSKKERPTDCVVCARPAKCCHFDVPSCLGCRSFFRRSILNQRTYSCKNNGNCQIGKGELCRSCRFDRCLLGGMDFRTIQKFPDGFSVDKISALLTEKKRKLSEKASVGVLSRIERSEVELLQLLIYFDNNLLYVRHSETDISTSIYFDKSMSDLINSDGGGLTYSIMARSDQFSKHKRVPKSFNFYQQRFREGDYSILSPNWLYIDSFLIIEMTKTMPVFQQLSFEDKIRLYSRNGMATVVFSALFYSKNLQGSEILIFPNGFSPLLAASDDKLFNILFYKHMIKMKEINLSREEFLILRNLIFLHTGLSLKMFSKLCTFLAKSELSKIGYGIVQTEIEKLSKALMFYERSRWGDAGGAMRFTNFSKLLYCVGFLKINLSDPYLN
uniref:Uncharacterized protein n=1 Tax=Meloidogyne enterolobii TaxID=390850 RepID=A0A6V7WYK9_MELEN|nr:unnamed protein product [Meloidogyne enterolobii]